MAITGRGRFNITALDEYGNIVPGATVTIRDETGLDLSTIYEDRDGLAFKSNPLIADENGYAYCYAEVGYYAVTINAYGRQSTLRDVEVGRSDPGPEGPAGPASGRVSLEADRSYYVRTDGDDGNTGLIDSAGGAFLTLNAAIAAAKTVDPGIYAIEIVLGAGTYTGNHVMDGPLITGSLLTIRGATGTATDVTLHSTSGDTLQIKNGAGAQLRDLQLTCAGVAECLEVSEQGTCYIDNIDFGACGRWHMHILTGGQLLVNGDYTISGDAVRHMLLILGGQFLIVVSGGRTCTLVGTRAFTNFFQAERGGLASMFNMSFVGTATGKRYQLASNAVVESFGGGASFFPGSIAGTTATGAYYN